MSGATPLRPDAPNAGLGAGLGGDVAAGLVLDVDGARVALRTVEAGLACCAVEQAAALALWERLGALPAAGAEPSAIDLHVLVVSGTVTDAMAPMIMRLYAGLPEPRGVLSFGACAGTGGPYWDSYVVTNGIDQLLPVDVYVPGCPPRPEAFVAGVSSLLDARSAREVDASAPADVVTAPERS